MSTPSKLVNDSSTSQILSPPTTPSSNPSASLTTRLTCRSKTHTTPTAGLAPTHIQANLLILPSIHASSFRSLCARNPVAIPLLAESSRPGDFNSLRSHLPHLFASDAIASELDIRTDLPRYNVYNDGVLVEEGVTDILEEWTQDHIAFLIGCSYSFENALTKAGLEPRHITQARNVPMYRTSIPLCPAGVFEESTYVVSLRMYASHEIEKVREITRAYGVTHGEPIAWGWDAIGKLGIGDLSKPEWGDRPLGRGSEIVGNERGDDGDVPVFWACGVTPQEAVMKAKLEGVVMAHSPGHMLVLDVRDWDIVGGKDAIREK